MVGADMLMTLEPLAEDALATVRRTTPVVSIIAACAEDLDE
ncbi:hypothetical protein QUV83_10225 [Cellulomonas cellasea]|nr:hypothetical protein [Cellulomonas cellasea]MDM8085141.1 hypothetical protein [Cellulomonas cellasea]